MADEELTLEQWRERCEIAERRLALCCHWFDEDHEMAGNFNWDLMEWWIARRKSRADELTTMPWSRPTLTDLVEIHGWKEGCRLHSAHQRIRKGENH